MQTNKKEAIWGASIIGIFLIGMFGWNIYEKNKYSTSYEESVSTSDSYDSKLDTSSSNDDSYSSSYSSTNTEVDSSSNSDDTNMTVEEVTENLIYIYMAEQYDLLTVNGDYYDAEYHDRLIANKAADEFGITPSQATDIYLRKDYENTFGN